MSEGRHKIPLIIRREYLTRVRKKSFIIMTILGPLLTAGMVLVPLWLSNITKEQRRVVVVDNSFLFPVRSMPSNENVIYNWKYIDKQFVEVQRLFKDSDDVSVLFIPENILKGGVVTLNSNKEPGLNTVTYVQKDVQKVIEEYWMIKNDVSEDVIRRLRRKIQVVSNIGDEESIVGVQIQVGFVASFIIYMFIFLYGAQIMRGVMEEKSNRIVEVIIASVKPFHLMMGKIIGVSLVGLTQFLLWIVLSFTVVGGLQIAFAKDYSAGTVVQNFAEQESMDGQQEQDQVEIPEKMNEVIERFNMINWPLMIGLFIFYFIGGYLLYGSFFAAIGSAVDNDTDTQQFMLPVSIPLIIGIMVAMISGLQDPHGSVAYWFSLFPLTSPVVMMVRIPFGVHWSQIVISAVLLIATFLGGVWLSGRIYRIGILRYGSKVSWGQIFKWIRMKQ
ncbi:MAG: ABC transporter permease [Flavobacteriales bacterium]|nr:ABC transporter permease [Flavobacteriales bacterium]